MIWKWIRKIIQKFYVQDMEHDDGGKYEGEFKDGKKHGQGALTFPDGRRFEGEFKDGKKHGQGALTLPDGEKYEGEWKDGDLINN